MKQVLVGFVILAALGAQAVLKVPVTEAEKAEQREKMLKATGGLLDIPAQGKIVVVNAQTKLPRALVDAAVGDVVKATRFNFEVRDGKFEMYKTPAGATGAIVLGDCPGLPMSVVAAENCWGLLNVAPLVSGDAARDEKRFRCELIRVMTFALGQSASQYKTSPLRAISNPEDLDAVATPGMMVDSQMAITKMLTERGMTKTRKTSYRKACKDGWAPAPTNEYQKAVWEQVKAEANAKPSNPIKITKPAK